MTRRGVAIGWAGVALLSLGVAACSIDAASGGARFKCDDSEPCPSGFECEFELCVSIDPSDCTPLLEDDFDDGERASLWSAVERAGATVTETDGTLVITPRATTTGSEAGYVADQLFNLANRRLVVEVPQMLSVGNLEGPNLVVNGDFPTADIAPWALMTFGTGAGTATVETGELHMAIQDGGTATSSVQVVQAGLAFEQGETYVVHFHARAPAARTIEMNVNEGVMPFTTYIQEIVNLTTTMDEYTYEFEMTGPSDPDARLDFNVGTSTVNVFIDDIEVYKKGDDPATLSMARVRAGSLQSSDYLFVAQQGGQLLVGVQQPAGPSVLAAVSYDPVEHRFWQMRDAEGATSFETSPDGATWTAHASTPTSATNVGASLDLSAEADNVASDPGQLGFDNVRLLPAGCE